MKVVCYIMAWVFAVFYLPTGIEITQAAGPDGRAYIAMGLAGQVAEIGLDNDLILRRFEAGTNPHGLAITPDGRYLYATSTKTGSKEMKHAPSPGGADQRHHKEKGQEKQEPADTESGRVTVIDTRSGDIVARVEIGAGTHHAAVTPDGRFAVVTVPSEGGVAIISTRNQEVVRRIPTGAVSNYVLATQDGKALYVSNTEDGTVTVIDTTSWVVQKQIRIGKGPGHLVENPDGRMIYAVNTFEGSVSVIDRARGKAVSTFQVGENPHGIDIHPDGKTVYVANQGSNMLTVYKVETKRADTWRTGERPYHLAVDPSGEKLYVGSRSLGKIWVLDPASGERLKEIVTGPVPHQVVFKMRNH